MSEELLLDKLKHFDSSKVQVKSKFILRFSEETDAAQTKKDDAIYDAHTGGNTGGSSTPSCTSPVYY